MKYFIDTSAFVALADRTDQYHSTAISFFKDQVGPSDPLHTSNYVLDETIARLRVSAGYHAALVFAESAHASRRHQIHQVDRDLELEALRLFKRYRDHDFSFTDCTTLALLDRLSITHLFAYDKVFRAVGYSLVPNL